MMYIINIIQPSSVYRFAEKGKIDAQKYWSRASVDISELIWREELEDEHKQKVNQKVIQLYIFYFILFRTNQINPMSFVLFLFYFRHH